MLEDQLAAAPPDAEQVQSAAVHESSLSRAPALSPALPNPSPGCKGLTAHAGSQRAVPGLQAGRVSKPGSCRLAVSVQGEKPEASGGGLGMGAEMKGQGCRSLSELGQQRHLAAKGTPKEEQVSKPRTGLSNIGCRGRSHCPAPHAGLHRSKALQDLQGCGQDPRGLIAQEYLLQPAALLLRPGKAVQLGGQEPLGKR